MLAPLLKDDVVVERPVFRDFELRLPTDMPAEVIAHAKAAPGKITYASAGRPAPPAGAPETPARSARAAWHAARAGAARLADTPQDFDVLVMPNRCNP